MVDGYNLLFAVGKKPRESDRNDLLNVLAAYKSRKNVDITVVFDRKTGDPAEGRQVLMHQGVRVVFTAPFQEADEIIRDAVDDAKRPKDILVVSSDKAGVSKYCRKVGAEVIGSKEFYEFLQRSRSGSGNTSRGKDDGEDEIKPNPGKDDNDYYFEKFTE